MRGMRVAAIAITVCLATAGETFAQGHDRFDGWCDSLQNSSPSDLVQFLKAAIPDEKNARCVTWTMHKLGSEHYEPAIPALVKLLDFRRPRTRTEEIFSGLSEELFPAEVALDMIGKSALPEVLLEIKADSASETARENAVSVWMEIHKYERPKGVALLKEEENKANDDATKRRLKFAVQTALKYCGVGMPEQPGAPEIELLVPGISSPTERANFRLIHRSK